MVDGTVFEMWLGGTMNLPMPLAQVLWCDRAEERKKGHGGGVPIDHPVTTRPVPVVSLFGITTLMGGSSLVGGDYFEDRQNHLRDAAGGFVSLPRSLAEKW